MRPFRKKVQRHDLPATVSSSGRKRMEFAELIGL
jgi:hypothetical protein